MGTQGYRIWRHQGRYLSELSRGNPWPSHLGIKHWNAVPRNPAEIDEWVEQTRAWVEERMASVEAGNAGYGCHVYARSKDVVYFGWGYEIDLDNCVFHVNKLPMYNLYRMPLTSETFLAMEDHEDNILVAYGTIPSENRWDSNMERFVRPVDSALLDTYAALKCTITVNVVPPPLETETTKVRRLWTQSFVNEVRLSRLFVSASLKLHTVKDTDELSDTTCDVLNFLNHVTLRPPIALRYETRNELSYKFCTRNSRGLLFYPPEEYLETRTTWIRPNLCVYIQPHLEDEDNLHAGVVRVIRAIDEHTLPEGTSTVYGVLNSITHCALVSYDVKSRTVSHTRAKVLLPPWGQDILGELTPGMLALTSLCQHLDYADGGYPGLPVLKTVGTSRLPLDVLAGIADAIDDAVTLIYFAASSPACKLAAKPRLMLPKLDICIATAACAEDRFVHCAHGEEVGLLEYWKSSGEEYLGIEKTLGLFTLNHARYYD